MAKKKKPTVDQAKESIRATLDLVQNQGEEEYMDFLDWLAGEAECREMAYREDTGHD